jgi:Immunity protein 26
LRVGDVFTVPLDDSRVGLGQVVARYVHRGHFYLALFEPGFPVGELPSASEVTALPIAFLALSMDAKVHAGHWVVVGNAPLPERLPLPAFKEAVGSPQRVDVVDYSGKRRRPARGSEAEWLPNRTIVAPVRLEKALKARHGLEPWSDAYAALEPSEAATSARLFDS